MPAGAQDESDLRNRIERSRDREQALSGAVRKLDGMLARMQREVTLVQGRLDAVAGDLSRARSQLATTRTELRAEHERLDRLRARLARGRTVLAAQLVSTYKAGRPDVVSLLVGSSDFADLLERVEFIRRAQDRNARVVDGVRSDRDASRRAAAALATLEDRRRDRTIEVARRHAALAAIRLDVGRRQAALDRARTVRVRALDGTRAGRRGAERGLRRLLAERARAATQSSGPGGPWAIPWPVVQCESGGQNLPPNGAGASGYYQFLPDTWQGLGGSTPQAYQASKAEQDRLAAQLWAGGAGAHNWVCAALVA